MELREGERVDFVNDDLELIQDTEGLTFGTDALLLAGYIEGRHKYGIELGGGSGIISMLLLTRGRIEKITAVEVQGEYADLIRRNAEHNRLSDRLFSVHADVRDFVPEGECDIVFSNPPYMKAGGGRACDSDKKNIARHEINGSIYDFVRAGARMLKYGGYMATVYRPDRLADLIAAYREAGIEPKRMTLVAANPSAVPSMVLIEGRRGGKSGMKLTRTLFIYRDGDNAEYSRDMNYIMENGAFPKGFGKN
ncbi:MAG: methyltransferase [Clostridia bacterium]|nr:methyltransferase [Clostridia bacterium]